MNIVPVAFRSLYKPVILFVVISLSVFINVILLPKYIYELFILILIFCVPLAFYLYIVLKKPKILISKNDYAFIIHKAKKDLIIPFETITSITPFTYKINNDIWIRTKIKRYRICDVEEPIQTALRMNEALRLHNLKKQ